MTDNKRDPKPETKQLPFFATDSTDKPITTRTGVRAGREAAMKRSGR